jgi:RimJ/RimL family protein N-acetyltransferase
MNGEVHSALLEADLNIEIDELIGDRVELRALKPEHVTGLFEAGKYPKIWTYMAPPALPINDVGDMARFAKEAIAQRRLKAEWPFVIIFRATDQIVGSTRYIDIATKHKGVEIGWTWLTPSVWRTSVNTECKYLLLRHAFETAGAIRVQLKTDSRNLQSQAAIERIGAVKEGILRRHRIMPDGHLRDSVYYSIIAEEWPAVKARLEGLLAR